MILHLSFTLPLINLSFFTASDKMIRIIKQFTGKLCEAGFVVVIAWLSVVLDDNISSSYKLNLGFWSKDLLVHRCIHIHKYPFKSTISTLHTVLSTTIFLVVSSTELDNISRR